MDKNMVRFTVDLAINEGKLDEFEGIAQSMIAGSQKEPDTLGYDWFLSADRKSCRLVETYRDANAALARTVRVRWCRNLYLNSLTCRASAASRFMETPDQRPHRCSRAWVPRSSSPGTD